MNHPIFARVYERMAPKFEAKGAAQHRARLLVGLSGRIIEVGAGTGLNFAHYPPEVAEVIAVEPEPHLRRLAERAGATAAVSVTVVDGDAEHLPFDDETFDAGVASLVLCSVPDQSRALGELRRVMRAGGTLRFYEHVRSERASLAGVQRALDLVWPYLGGGCHTSRDTAAAICASGFQIHEIERFNFRPVLSSAPVAPHVIGSARRP